MVDLFVFQGDDESKELQRNFAFVKYVSAIILYLFCCVVTHVSLGSPLSTWICSRSQSKRRNKISLVAHSKHRNNRHMKFSKVETSKDQPYENNETLSNNSNYENKKHTQTQKKFQIQKKDNKHTQTQTSAPPPLRGTAGDDGNLAMAIVRQHVQCPFGSMMMFCVRKLQKTNSLF